MQPSPTLPHRLPNLDLLRLIAALMVVAFHFCYRGPQTPGWMPASYPVLAPFAAEMWAGVSLFFIISGFVIAWSAENRGAFDFALSRLARLYPAFLACMTLTALGLALLAPPGVDEFRMSLARWLANLPLFSKVLGQSFVDGAYWSIVVEVVFYAWVALFLALGLFQRRQMALLAGWIALALLNELVLHQSGLRHLFATRHAGYFVLGILAYRAFAAGRWPDLREIALGLFAFGLCLLDDRAYVSWMRMTLDYAPMWSPLFAAGKLAAMLIVLAAAITLPPLLPYGLSLALGGLTYPLYLIHQNLGYVLLHRLDPVYGSTAALALTTAAAISVAWLVHRHVEPVGRSAILGVGRTMGGDLQRRPRTAGGR
jgi:peptidoglycan/LPS O-acetylase OafA/YrhL